MKSNKNKKDYEVDIVSSDKRVKKESRDFLQQQIITYIGNKRKLLQNIDNEIILCKNEIGLKKIKCCDLFSGSGVVARLMKQHSRVLTVNDMELYSKIINKCYLANASDFDIQRYEYYYEMLRKEMDELICGVICDNYAPQDENNIISTDRVFYTRKNAKIIDTTRAFIDKVDDDYKHYFLAPLLYSASVHTNTSGVFKGFYKSKETGIGKFGGDGENALQRIKGEIQIMKPIFSNFNCKTKIFQQDANELVLNMQEQDIVYLDPPYDQHPYGSNYFMLNVITRNIVDTNISKVSGIPSEWNRSDYNKSQKIHTTFDDLIKNTKSKYIIISYNSEGFMSFGDIMDILSQYGVVSYKTIKYNTFRGSRNLKDRDNYVDEYLFTLKKI